MTFSFQVVIPARYGSTRLRGKPLLDIGGMTLIQHVYDSALRSRAGKVIIATDDERIEDLSRSFGAEVIMTSSEHKSGTDRITEVIKRKKIPDETIIVNVQGDEFGLAPELIDQVAMCLHENPDKQMATLCEQITNIEDLNSPDVVKLVRDRHNNALYFSRTTIPWSGAARATAVPEHPVDRHIGIYACRAGFLKAFSVLDACPLEETERLEQLRALYNGYRIHVEPACVKSGFSIDTARDLELARKLYKH